MLILTRRENEAIMIYDNIEVCVLEIRGAQVRLGISAPKEVPVHREEIHAKIIAQAAQKRLEAELVTEEEED